MSDLWALPNLWPIRMAELASLAIYHSAILVLWNTGNVKIITYDIEIAQEVDDFPDRWEAARRGECGIASVILYDTDSGRYHIYDTRTLSTCVAHLNSASLLVGFNSVEFDGPVVEAVSGERLIAPQYDILQAVWRACGKKHKGYGLGPICERTIGLGKSGDGERAPKLFKEGRFAELHDYNLNDVYMTRILFNHIIEYKSIIDHKGNPLEVWVPEEVWFA